MQKNIKQANTNKKKAGMAILWIQIDIKEKIIIRKR